MFERPGYPALFTAYSWVASIMVVGAIGCGDGDGANSTTISNGSSDTGGALETTSDGVSASSANPATGVDGSTGGSDPTSSAESTSSADNTSSADSTSSSGSDDGGSSSSGQSPMPFDVPFAVLDTHELPLVTRVQPGWTLITSAAEWAAFTDAAVPMGVSFPRQWLVYGSHGPEPFSGHEIEVGTLTWDAQTLQVDGNAIEPGVGCETFHFMWPTDTLLVIDALAVDVNAVDDHSVPVASSCAMGVTYGDSCSLDNPCGTGMLCASSIPTPPSNVPGNGFCGDVTQAGVFNGGAVVIPSDGTVVETNLLVGGLTTVALDVVVWLELDHPAPEELLIELHNPFGTTAIVADLQNSPLHPGGVGIALSAIPSDEAIDGIWSLTLSDGVVNGNNGGLLSWQLEIMSIFD